MTKDEALRMALAALEKMDNCCPAIDPSGQDAHDTAYQTMHILRIVINEAQPEQEPVARFDANDLIESLGTVTFLAHQGQQLKNGDKLYTTPPKRKEWVGLTDDEIFKTHKQVDSMQYLTFGKAIEAKLKEKNHD